LSVTHIVYKVNLRGSGGTAPHILNRGIKSEWSDPPSCHFTRWERAFVPVEQEVRWASPTENFEDMKVSAMS